MIFNILVAFFIFDITIANVIDVSWKIKNDDVFKNQVSSPIVGKLDVPIKKIKNPKNYKLFNTKNDVPIILEGLVTPDHQKKVKDLSSETTFCFYLNAFWTTGRQSFLSIEALFEKNSSSEKENIWYGENNVKDDWMFITTKFTQGDRKFVALIITSNSNTLAINDAVLKTGSCLVSLTCTFDSEMDCILEKPNTSTEQNYKFTKLSALDFPNVSFDHTTTEEFGHFLAVSSNQTLLSNPNEKNALLFSKPISTGVYCVSFWIWKNEQLDNVEIILSPAGSKLSNITGQKIWESDQQVVTGKEWSFVQRTIRVDGLSNLILQAQKRETNFNPNSELLLHTPLIDDFRLQYSPCESQNSIDCSFENDLCGWQVDKEHDDMFLIGFGRLSDSDHFELAENLNPGKVNAKRFLYSNLNRKQKSAAIFSSVVSAKSVSCLKISFRINFFPYNSNSQTRNQVSKKIEDGGFKVILLHDSKKETLANFNEFEDTYDEWSEVSFNVSSLEPYRIMIEATSGLSGQTIVSINKISYFPNEVCEN